MHVQSCCFVVRLSINSNIIIIINIIFIINNININFFFAFIMGF